MFRKPVLSITLILLLIFSFVLSSFAIDTPVSLNINPNEYKVFSIDKKGGIELTENKVWDELENDKIVKEALNLAPSWLKEDLKNQFYDIYRRPINVNENATLATGDLNGDGYLDIIAGGKNNLTPFINMGIPFSLSLNKALPIELEEFKDKEINPSLFDINNDGFSDLIVGVQNRVYISMNKSLKDEHSFQPLELIFEASVEEEKKENLTPFAFKLDNELVIALGYIDGTLSLLRKSESKWREDKEFFTVWQEKWSDDPKLPWERKGIVVPGNASPAIYPLNDGNYLLVIGSGVGTLETYKIARGDTGYIIQTFDIIPQFPCDNFISPAFIDVNGDTRVDLLLGFKDGSASYILNYGGYNEIKFVPLNSGAEKNPLNDFFGGSGYFRPYDQLYAYGYNREQITEIAKFINGVNKPYLDEVIYCIANFQIEDLLSYTNLNLLNLLIENVKGIYDISEKLSYVKVKELSQSTTLEYATENGFKEMPEEIYYKYLVMLNRYLSIPTGYEKSYEKNFYRTFLPYDTLYGKSLYDAVKDSKTLYDAAYNVDKWLRVDIGGIWHTGNKPSGWYNIYKNLLNKDLGIWCGEWSIIYEAAARAVNIPTIIIVALGEDHQFNNFWADGWHHVDSSSGSSGEDGTWKEFFDDSLIYYRQWGGRIFSWPMEWEGDGKYDHVWRSVLPYNPPELLSDLTFFVTDKNGLPIDGARIELWSHWPMEGEKPYNTVPFISAIGYTNSSGYATIKMVGHQNFTTYVVSRIGSVNFFLSLKGKSGGKYSFNVNIPAEIPKLFKYETTLNPIFDPTPKKVEIVLKIGNPVVKINGKEQPPLEAVPFIDKPSGRTFVPVRLISEAFGAEIVWEPVTRQISITTDDITISIKIDSPIAIVNGKEVLIDDKYPKLAPMIVNGITVIPIRFIAENFGCEVKWDDMTETITIIYYINPAHTDVLLNLGIGNFVQGNYHWIDAYNTVLRYTDYWKQDTGTIYALILSEEEFHNFLLGLDIKKGNIYRIEGEEFSIIEQLPKEGSFCIVLYNPNLTTSATLRIK